ncbi:hypothetical protein NDU88_001434 [Pleurodeles waltl]|uniref:Murine leukemia virus integrase C-terminal domain-containing protein n=1 Tax=Pleurodeles waltl TaxID=8319 RepID=A0AAV7T049_PLEWA|nr:hypothetical protein NDU88_001434 [Pleurodeles waltl]
MALDGAIRPALPGVRGKKPRTPDSAGVGGKWRMGVEAAAVQTAQEQCHSLKAVDWVVVKKHVRKTCLEPRRKGPFQVILMTTTAVK